MTDGSGLPQLSPTNSAFVLGMFAVWLMLIVAYGYEYIRYKTIKPRIPRRLNKVMFGWVALMGLYFAVTVSIFLGAAFWVLALGGYLWDRYIVDRMP